MSPILVLAVALAALVAFHATLLDLAFASSLVLAFLACLASSLKLGCRLGCNAEFGLVEL